MFNQLLPRLAQGAAFGARYALQSLLLHGVVAALLALLGFGPQLAMSFRLGGA